LAAPVADARLQRLTQRLLIEAEALYLRSEAGIAALPLACRPGIFAARHVYAGIGGAVARRGYDSVSVRAHTTGRQKLGWLGLSVLRAAASVAMPASPLRKAAPEPEVVFLVEAAARKKVHGSRTEALFAVLAQLEAQDRSRRSLERLDVGHS
jgi:phytoene synthase